VLDPVLNRRDISFTAKLGETPKRNAACRRERPLSIKPITRSRKSAE
jgi:hypothetical protein